MDKIREAAKGIIKRANLAGDIYGSTIFPATQLALLSPFLSLGGHTVGSLRGFDPIQSHPELSDSEKRSIINDRSNSPALNTALRSYGYPILGAVGGAALGALGGKLQGKLTGRPNVDLGDFSEEYISKEFADRLREALRNEGMRPRTALPKAALGATLAMPYGAAAGSLTAAVKAEKDQRLALEERLKNYLEEREEDADI